VPTGRSGPLSSAAGRQADLWTVLREWSRIGVIGFGGPPAHINLFRRLCVDREGWLTAHEFEDGIAATNLLPGPASTQLAIFCAWRIAGIPGAVVGGLAFICPGLVLIVALASVFLASQPPTVVLGAAAGAGAAVPAVALAAAAGLVPNSLARAGTKRGAKGRWIAYLVAGGTAAALVGPYLVVVIALCGLIEILVRRPGRAAPPPGGRRDRGVPALIAAKAPLVAAGGLGALAWVAFKVGALSYGGGFVIIPLMQHSAVDTYHWLTGPQFLDAVALGQVTPGPVVQTVAVVGYAAGGVGGALLAAAVAFAPSFVFVLAFGPHFDRLRSNRRVQAFLTGAGATAIGAIAGSAIPLGMELQQWWQLAVLVAAGVWLLAVRKRPVLCLLTMGAVGAVVVALGAPVR
jgi:chromate transporter